MNQTMDSTIVEFLLHKNNFVLTWLDREEPGVKRKVKFEIKITTQNCRFSKKPLYSPAFLHNFRTKSNFHFSDPFIKLNWEKFGSLRFVSFFGTNSPCPSMAKQNGILSIIHAINRPDSWHKAFILYSVSENETLKPNQCHYLEIPRLVAYKCSKKASDQHYKHPAV